MGYSGIILLPGHHTGKLPLVIWKKVKDKGEFVLLL
jgi:hypothetical protein